MKRIILSICAIVAIAMIARGTYVQVTKHMNTVEFIVTSDLDLDGQGMVSGYILIEDELTTTQLHLYVPVYLLDKEGDKYTFDHRLLDVDSTADYWIEYTHTYLTKN